MLLVTWGLCFMLGPLSCMPPAHIATQRAQKHKHKHIPHAARQPSPPPSLLSYARTCTRPAALDSAAFDSAGALLCSVLLCSVLLCSTLLCPALLCLLL